MLQSMGLQRIRHNWATEQQNHIQSTLAAKSMCKVKYLMLILFFQNLLMNVFEQEHHPYNVINNSPQGHGSSEMTANCVTKMIRELHWGLQARLLQTQSLSHLGYPQSQFMGIFNTSQLVVFQEKPVNGEIGWDNIGLSSKSEIGWPKWETDLINIFLVLMGIHFF